MRMIKFDADTQTVWQCIEVSEVSQRITVEVESVVIKTD